MKTHAARARAPRAMRSRAATADGQVLRVLSIGADLQLPELAVQQPGNDDPTRDAHPAWPAIGAGGKAAELGGIAAPCSGTSRFASRRVPTQDSVPRPSVHHGPDYGEP